MITHARVIEVKATKKKDAAVSGMSMNVSIDNVAIEGNQVKVAYTYEMDYKEDVATMSVKGELFADLNSELGKKVAEGWKKNKQIPPEAAEEFITALTYTGSSVGTLLAFAININAPINIPRAKIGPGNAAPKAG
ncbi:MAG: hypothetical protein WC408_04925 [Candidatus Micrarchaeia archaeon]|jgi:hypothetical protein